MKSVKSQIDNKSLAAFAVLIAFSFAAAWFVLSKSNEAIAEFEKLNSDRELIIKKSSEDAN